MGMSKKKRCRLWIPIVMIAATGVFLILKLEPAFVKYLDANANTLITNAVNQGAAEVFEEYRTNDLYFENEESFSINAAEVNALKSEITLKIQGMLNDESSVSVPLGSATGIYLLNSLGPPIPVRLKPISLVSSDFEENFSSAGINFVKHSLYITVSVEVNYSGFLLYKNSIITAKIPVIEHITSGEVPKYYGMNTGIALEEGK